MFQKRGSNIHTHAHVHTQKFNRKIQVNPPAHSFLSQNGVYVRAEVSVCQNICVCKSIWHTRLANWCPCIHTHILEAVYHLTAASVLMYVLCKTHPHPNMHYADSICVSLVQNWQNYEREQRENWPQSMNHCCMLLWYQQSPEVTQCLCMRVCVYVGMCESSAREPSVPTEKTT